MSGLLDKAKSASSDEKTPTEKKLNQQHYYQKQTLQKQILQMPL